MRILIADDSVALPPEVLERYTRVPVTNLFGGRAAQRGAQAGPVIVDCGGERQGERAGAAVGLDEDGCERIAPVPLCPPFDLRDQPELLATVLDALGIALLNRGCLQAGRQLTLQALEIRRRHFGDEHPATAASLQSEARVLRTYDDLAGAEASIMKALAINIRAYGRASPAVAANLTELGIVQLYQGRFTAAERTAGRGLAILARLRLTARDPNTTRLMDIQGRALHGRGELKAAHRLLSKAVDLDAKQVGTDHPKYATHLANLAAVQRSQGDLKAAERGYRHAVHVYEDVLQRLGHPNLIDLYSNLGALLASRGSCADAQVLLCKALALSRQVRGSKHTLVGHDHARLGRLYYQLDLGADLGRARRQFAKALGIYQANVSGGTLPKNHPYIAEALTWQGRMLIEDPSIDPAQAQKLLERAAQTWGPEYSRSSVERAITDAALGRALFLQKKQLDRARRLLNGSYAIVVKARGADSSIARLILEWKNALAPRSGGKALLRRKKKPA